MMKLAPIALLLCAGVALAEPPQPPQPPRPPHPPRASHGPGMHGDPGMHDDALRGVIFPPDLIMEKQSEIGLTDAQRKAIVAEMQRFHADSVPIQFDMKAEADKLHKLLAAPKIDEAALTAQLDKVTALEAKMKRAHLLLLARIKNQLTPAQQEKLRAAR